MPAVAQESRDEGDSPGQLSFGDETEASFGKREHQERYVNQALVITDHKDPLGENEAAGFDANSEAKPTPGNSCDASADTRLGGPKEKVEPLSAAQEPIDAYLDIGYDEAPEEIDPEGEGTHDCREYSVRGPGL
jgi:hypothetical protein